MRISRKGIEAHHQRMREEHPLYPDRHIRADGEVIRSIDRFCNRRAEWIFKRIISEDSPQLTQLFGR